MANRYQILTTKDTSYLVTSGRTVTVLTGLTGGGNLSRDMTLGISTDGATVGQMMITSGGTALGGVAWVNTAGGGSSVVYAATGNRYVVESVVIRMLFEAVNTFSFDRLESGEKTK